jgi:RND family efflux transporter MFP subunit
MLNQQLRLQHTTITAPDSGTIVSRGAALGAVVQTGTELFRLIRQDRLEWRAEVTGQEVGKIREGQPATLTLPTGEVLEGQVRMIGPTLDANTRSALVYIALPSGSGARAGMYASGTILNGMTEAMTLPQSAVILRDGSRYIFTVGSDNRVKQNKVKTGSLVNGNIEILSGIALTDDVVTTGGAFLQDGDLIQRATPSTTPPSTETPKP